MQQPVCHPPFTAVPRAQQLAGWAREALIAEVWLTPKPGLVDGRGSGAHADMTLALMVRSARALEPTFYALALAGWQRHADVALRSEVGRLGRAGEQTMLAATGGVNTHRGAIWALGLLVTALAMQGEQAEPERTVFLAAALARLTDPAAPRGFSHGLRASRRFRLPGAREEAQRGFPHVMQHALPQMRRTHLAGGDAQAVRLDGLLAIMSHLSDTCVLSRGGLPALAAMQSGAQRVLALGGYGTPAGRLALASLDRQLLKRGVSPGGAADLLAAALLLARAFPLSFDAGQDHGKD
ncbi:triphosphoribosyl-dephospho-CoA synthase [Pantoea sp. 1.19]|uniref:triphosphoribosyl-dephospho-CoA synthase n=1 Tax=Pantoea sp. 1.19 TaxID=1925589 RepID=UPI000948CCEE|nr:triphosphoribosyl-dephospho-CoA synthase [Pantoea sp. 1.19]